VNTTELIAQVRLNALLEDGMLDYTDSVIIRELNHSLTTKFERMVTDARAGYWLQSKVFTATAGNPIIRMPPRACGLSKVDLGDVTSDPVYQRLPQMREGHTNLYTAPASSTGRPQHWVARGDRIVLFPAPDDAYKVRVWYYLRPSRLVPAQASSLNGQITSVNRTARTLTVLSAPTTFDESGTSTSLPTNGTIDVVSPSGWHEVQLAEALFTSSGLVFTLTADADTSFMNGIQAGDMIRDRGQSEWPPLPDDFHRCLADITSIKILIQRDFQAKAMGYAQDVNSDLSRFSSLINDRVQEEVRTPRAELPSLRRRW
jgi:hypothetical protein